MSGSGRKSIADKFGPAASATNLGNRLPRTAAPEAPTAGEETQPATRSTPPDSASTVQVNVHLMPHVIALAEHARAGRTNADIVLDALDQGGDLPSLLDRHRGQSAPASGPSRFRRNRTPRSRASATPRRPWTFRVSRDDVAVLDQLVRESGAASRSELVEAALAAAHR